MLSSIRALLCCVNMLLSYQSCVGGSRSRVANIWLYMCLLCPFLMCIFLCYRIFLLTDRVASKKNKVAEMKGQRLYCVCRQPNDKSRMMVQCDCCKKWFHPQCMNVGEEEVQALAEWHCTRCSHLFTHKSPLSHKRKSLASLFNAFTLIALRGKGELVIA